MGTSDEKIKVLGSLHVVDDPDTLDMIIAMFDDDDIKVRGEVFGSLVLNENCITRTLIKNLDSTTSPNIKSFVALVLANRGETSSIPYLIRLASDTSSMVRSCVVGALGHLKAQDDNAVHAVTKSLFDDNIHVRKSAAHAITLMNIDIPMDTIRKVSDAWSDVNDDAELDMLYARLVAKMH